MAVVRELVILQIEKAACEQEEKIPVFCGSAVRYPFNISILRSFAYAGATLSIDGSVQADITNEMVEHLLPKLLTVLTLQKLIVLMIERLIHST